MSRAEDIQDAPPSYSEATGGARPSSATATATTTHLSPSSAAASDPRRPRRVSRNGIPAAHRRSMEDEQRPVPEGWVRQYDATTSHQFFVDTRADPPRSIWHHPYDDEQYLSTLTPEQRQTIVSAHRPSTPDPAAHTTDEESPVSSPVDEKKGRHHLDSDAAEGPNDAGVGSSSTAAQTDQGHAPAPAKDHNATKPSFGRRVKDKLTGTTHEEREARRKEEAERERKAYEMHRRVRAAMQRAVETGQPQPIGKDKDGHDLYIEPPQGPVAGGYGYGYGSGYGYSGTQPPSSRGSDRGRAYNPYTEGPYANPNARFIRPSDPYSRPAGYGYGGGLGAGPGLFAGSLLGGLLVGDLLLGF